MRREAANTTMSKQMFQKAGFFIAIGCFLAFTRYASPQGPPKNEDSLLDQYTTQCGISGTSPECTAMLRALDPTLKGLKSVRVMLRTDAPDSSRAFELTGRWKELEDTLVSKLRTAGLNADTPTDFIKRTPSSANVERLLAFLHSEQMDRGAGLRIEVRGYPAPTLVVTVDLMDSVYPMRFVSPANATELPVLASTWNRLAIVNETQPESVSSIVARYKTELRDPNIAEAFRAVTLKIKEHMMDLEVQAAMASAQHPAASSSVRDTVIHFIDEFTRDWRAANPQAQ